MDYYKAFFTYFLPVFGASLSLIIYFRLKEQAATQIFSNTYRNIQQVYSLWKQKGIDIKYSEEVSDKTHHELISIREDVFNALELMCTLIERGNLNEKLYREAFSGFLEPICKSHPEYLNKDNEFQNLTKVYNRWILKNK